MTLWDIDHVPLPPAQQQILTSAAVTEENRILVLLDSTSFAAHLTMKNKTAHILSIHLTGVSQARAVTENTPGRVRQS